MRTEIDHVAIRTAEYDKARAFFEDVFSMKCYRETGWKPERKLWFLEGVQLCEVEVPPSEPDGIGVEAVSSCLLGNERDN